MEDSQQQDFKLLAIQPRKGCHADFRKVLKEAEIYAFYPSYQFTRNSKGEVIRITGPKDEPRLYDLDGLSVNISAVVGKNGSGKSTLTELLYYLIYCLGISLKKDGSSMDRILPMNTEELAKEAQQLREEKKEGRIKLQRLIEQIDQLNKEAKSWTITKKLTELRKKKRRLREKINETRLRLEEIHGLIPAEKKAYNHIRKHYKVSVFYQLAGGFYELRFNHKLYLYQIIDGMRKILSVDSTREVLGHFFYTISINYSHYALNSNFVGSWTNTLFHKNDAYLAPVVINPMRIAGNFDINDENSFALYRLLYNLLIEKLESPDQKVKITDNQYVEKVRFQLDPSKTGDAGINIKENSLSGSSKTVDLFMELQDVFFDDSYLSKEILFSGDLPFQNEIYNYIVRKLDKISRTYSIYDRKNYKFRLSNPSGNKSFLKRLKKDNSHITFKLKQAINFLRTNMSQETSPWSTPTGYDQGLSYFDFTLEKLLSWTSFYRRKSEELISFLPPSIFTIDLYLSNLDDDKSTANQAKFSALSSGEQQLIHSVQSVLYHLNNLQSAHSSNDGRQTYKAVNIIYDEIELYFHPEYQRQFIKQFLRSIERLDIGGRNGIEHVNMLFSTHSPFVLSDIPGTNVLRLDVGRPEPFTEKSKAFGANIYSLLKDSFFLEAYIGEHAKEEIEKLIKTLQVKSKEETFDLKVEVLNDTPEQLKKRIELIGEPFLRDKLWEMYYTKFDTEKRIGELERELERLKNKDL